MTYPRLGVPTVRLTPSRWAAIVPPFTCPPRWESVQWWPPSLGVSRRLTTPAPRLNSFRSRCVSSNDWRRPDGHQRLWAGVDVHGAAAGGGRGAGAGPDWLERRTPHLATITRAVRAIALRGPWPSWSDAASIGSAGCD